MQCMVDGGAGKDKDDDDDDIEVLDEDEARLGGNDISKKRALGDDDIVVMEGESKKARV